MKRLTDKQIADFLTFLIALPGFIVILMPVFAAVIFVLMIVQAVLRAL